MKDRWPVVIGVVALGLVVVLLQRIWVPSAPTAEQLLADVPEPHLLREQTKQFQGQEVIQVVKGVHVFIGYALANVIVFDAPEGLIVVDTTESVESAQEVLKAIRELTDRPIKAIVLTHFHADHINGAMVFMEDETKPPEVWAHKQLQEQLDSYQTVGTAGYRRAMRQFGTLLPSIVNAGIGIRLRYNSKLTMAHLRPTNVIEKDTDVTIAGMQIRLLHIPGETPEQIGLWLADRKVLLPADDFYKAFPNLYAIRGTATRDVMYWVNSVDKLKSLKPHYLIPQHSRPIIGEYLIASILTDYRDAMQFLHDQTVRYLNRGYLPEEIVEKVTLPKRLAEHPYLNEVYGTVDWSVRGVFSQYMGWFSGDVVDLSPLPKRARAEHMIKLLGGESKICRAAQEALDAKDYQWALELASHVFLVNPSSSHCLKTRTSAIKQLAAKQTSSNGRNYYLTHILEDHNLVENKPNDRMKANVIQAFSAKMLFTAMKTRLVPESVDGLNTTYVMNFTDTKEIYSLHLRNSIIDVVEENSEEYTFKLTCALSTWKGVLAKERSFTAAYMSGEIVVDGSLLDVKTFQDFFENID